MKCVDPGLDSGTETDQKCGSWGTSNPSVDELTVLYLVKSINFLVLVCDFFLAALSFQGINLNCQAESKSE